jgi:hypothetical protein
MQVTKETRLDISGVDTDDARSVRGDESAGLGCGTTRAGCVFGGSVAGSAATELDDIGLIGDQLSYLLVILLSFPLLTRSDCGTIKLRLEAKVACFAPRVRDGCFSM